MLMRLLPMMLMALLLLPWQPAGAADAPASAKKADSGIAGPGNETAKKTGKPEGLRERFRSAGQEGQVEVYSYRRKDGAKVEEYSVHGRVYMLKIQPVGGLPAYYLYDNDGDGVFERSIPGNYKPLSPPMWVIKRF